MPRVLEKYNMKDLGSARAIKILMQENASLKNALPTAHISTTSTQLTDSAEDLPIEHVKIKGATSQEQYEGRNKLRNSLSILQTNNTSGIWNDNKYVLNDVTFTVNNDLSITANGTASQNASFYVNRTGNYEMTNLSAGTYYLTSHETTGSNSTWKLQYSVGGNNYNIFGTGSNKEVEVTLTEESTVVATIIVYAEKTVNNVAFYPMISTSSGTDYEKYVGRTSFT